MLGKADNYIWTGSGRWFSSFYLSARKSVQANRLGKKLCRCRGNTGSGPAAKSEKLLT